MLHQICKNKGIQKNQHATWTKSRNQDAGYDNSSAAWWHLYRAAGGLRLKSFSEINIEILWWECIQISQSCFGHMTCLQNLETNSLDGSASFPARVFSMPKRFGCLYFQMFDFSRKVNLFSRNMPLINRKCH